MLSLRLQRTGRKGYAQYRLIAQDSHRSPSSGKVAAYLGHYNPHTKETKFDKEKVEFYLKNGAQPSHRVALLISKEGVKLPEWYKAPVKKERSTKHPDKLRKNQPVEEPAAEEKPSEEEKPGDTEASEAAPAESAEEKKAEDSAQEASKDDAAEETKE